jgi:aminopeptidase N
MRAVCFFLAASAALAVWLPAAARADVPFNLDTTPGKLPKTIVPTDYDIALKPNVTTFTFTGTETVKINARSTAPTVIVNTHDMTVSRASLDGHTATSIATDNQKQITTLTFAKPVQPGRHVLALAFAGKIGDQPAGLFYQKYRSPSGEKVMLASQMESTDARRMFPGWDEPAFRATFRLRVTVPKQFDAVSNMPQTNQTIQGDTKVVQFARTPSMASYLVVLCAGEFGYLTGSSGSTVVRLVAPKGREQNGRYALDAAEKLLAYYNDYFGYKYPLPKLDLIDVPGGFPGAMENWGGITFTEDTLLFNPAVEPEDAKIDVFETIAHEMAHQWMGDLVTMAWWDNLWLNEGFADWMQTKATDHFNPQWHLWERVNGDVEFAMQTDSQTTTHPVYTPIENEAQADSAFDEITYQKGGAFIRMTEQYLGPDTFRDGLRVYLRKHAYSNTTSADMYTELSAVSHQDVAGFAKAWTTDPGFPLVHVAESCVGGAQSLAVSQRRFFYEPGQTSSQLWDVPLFVTPATGASQPSTYLLQTQSSTVKGPACGQPAIVNAGGYGYFRAHYDPATTSALVAALPQMDAPDRVRMLNDTAAFVIAGLAQPGEYLGLIDRLGADQNLAVWQSSINGLNQIAGFETARSGSAAFDAYRRRVLRPVLDRIGWGGTGSDDATAATLRQNVIAALGAAGDPDVIAESRKRFAAFLTNPQSLTPDLRGTVLNVVGSYADAATWKQLHDLYKAAHNEQEGRVLASALWHARDPQLAQKNLDMVLNGDIPAEAGPIAAFEDIFIVASNGRQPHLAWEFFKTNAPAMATHLSSFERAFLVSRGLPAFWNAAPYEELEAFGKANTPPDATAQLTQALHQVKLQIAVADRLTPLVDQWVAAHPTTTAAH